jgi:type I restriction enzyme R subunit
MTSDTSEKGLESLICSAMTGAKATAGATGEVQEEAPGYGGTGWSAGQPGDYEREYAVDLVQLRGFLANIQPEGAASLSLDQDGPTRRKFLARLQGEISKRGLIDVLRHGIKHGPHQIDLFYGTPSPGNAAAAKLYGQNRFTVTRQLRYSRDESKLALDLGLFINGLPIITFELKNNLTKQTVEDAVEQYRRDRDPRELIFQPGRCMVHLAVDDQEIRFCTELRGKQSWFLPFNKGWRSGAGNPPNPNGIKTDYLWKQILTSEGLTNIIENYAQTVAEKDRKTGKIRSRHIFPRYHQLDVVRKLLADAEAHGVGHRYLIQHSAGSGKSNSIAWLAHQLISVQHAGARVFDSIIVVTDRVLLDDQIKNTIKHFTQVGATVGHAERSGDLRRLIAEGKKIIITTVQKFPHILDDMGNEHRNRHFAIVIDEAHSSQGGRTATAMSRALGEAGATEEEETIEDQINRLIEARKLLPNASYYAFTATPKNKTLELFGEPYTEDGQTKHRPFHVYTMKQAIEERFILDVLRYYTPVDSWYRLIKRVEADPEFDVKRANKKLRHYVESHDYAIRVKAEIVVDHFRDQVLALRKIGGEARAMVVTGSILRAIQYFQSVSEYLIETKSPYRAIVAFSGEHEYKGHPVSEASLNGFPSQEIADRIKEDPYRFLVCADKFQTGYDEPLLHTMYVDKPLAGIKAVQTLSRLNRAHPMKSDVFVLDFMNDTDTIEAAFKDYYQTTVLSGETDPNKLHDLQADLDAYEVYSHTSVDSFAALYLGGAERDQLDPILDACVATYKQDLDEDGQVDFKGKAKAFVRTYAFLSSILPYSNPSWEKLSILLNFLILKLPAPVEEDLSRGVLETIDMDSYRAEKRATMKIALADADAEIGPVPAAGGGHSPEVELERLSNILKAFNDMFGNIQWADSDRVHRMVFEEIPAKVAMDKAYQNARKNSDKQNARIEHDKALQRAISGLFRDDSQLFKQFSDNESFRKWVADMIFKMTYEEGAA